MGSNAEGASSQEYGAIALVFLLGLALRIWGLQAQSLTMDEVTDLGIAAQSVEEIVRLKDGFPPLYHLLLHGWARVVSGGESVRWLSVLLGSLSILAMWRLARQVGGARVGVWTALLLAISPFHVWYSQEARAYVLYFLLAILVLWFFFRALESDRVGDWALYGLVAAVGVYTHYYFAVLLLINGALLLAAKRRWRDLKPALLAHAGLVLLVVPALWLLRSDLSHQAAFQSLYAPFNAAAIGYTYFTFIAGFSLGPSMRELHATRAIDAVIRVLPWALILGFVVITLAYHGFKVLGGRSSVRLTIIAVAPVLVSGLLAGALGVGFRVRYILWAAIPLLVIFGAGLSRPGFRWPAAASALVIVAISAVSLANRHTVRRYQNEDIRGVSARLKSVASRSTPIFVMPGYMAPTMRYYLGDGWFVCALPSAGRDRGDPWRALSVLERKAAGPFWLVYTRPFHGDPRGAFKSALLRPGLIRERAEFAGVKLYEGTAAPRGSLVAASRDRSEGDTPDCVEFPDSREAAE